MKCYEIKNCTFNGTDPEKSKCPPHRLQIGCWEHDWISFYKNMPDCTEKLEWREIMLKACPVCEVYKLHEVEMKDMLYRLASL